MNYMFRWEGTNDWEKFYHQNGFVVVRDVFGEADCDIAVRIFENYAKPDFRGIMNLDRGFVEYEEEGIEVISRHAKFISDIVRDIAVVNILEGLQRSRVSLLQTMFLFKKVGSPYAKQAWNPHQDNAYSQAPYGMYITGNIAFADQDPENGGMSIYPGSHHMALLPNIPAKSFGENPGEKPGHCVKVPEQYLAKKIDLYLPKGSVLMLHGNVIHESYPNTSPTRSRPMLLIPYGTEGISRQPGFISGKVAKRMEIPLR